MFITSKNKYLSNDMKIFGTCSIPLIRWSQHYSYTACMYVESALVVGPQKVPDIAMKKWVYLAHSDLGWDSLQLYLYIYKLASMRQGASYYMWHQSLNSQLFSQLQPSADIR